MGQYPWMTMRWRLIDAALLRQVGYFDSLG